MIYLTLPLLYQNQWCNNKLRQLSQPSDKIYQYFKINNLNISSFYGSIPFFIYNGGINSNIQKEKFLADNDLFNFLNSQIAPIRLDCSNNFLKINDLYDYYFNLVLQYGNSGNNFLEISDFDLMDYINNKGFNYNFILSKNANLKIPFTATNINQLIQQDLLYLIELPINFNNDIQFLNQLINKDKIEITIGCKCPLNCKNLSDCMTQEQQYQINYSNQTIFNNCNKINHYNNINELYNELNKFIKLGFTHFKIDTPPRNQNYKFQQYLIKNLINDKYQLLFYDNNEGQIYDNR